MTKQELQQLFKNEILPENDNPYHFQESQRASFTVEANNSMCGDKYTLYFNASEGHITSVYFYGLVVPCPRLRSLSCVKAWNI